MSAKYLPGFASWISPRVERVAKMIPNRTGDFSPIFSAWSGTPILLFVIRQCRVPIPCYIIGESVAAVRIRLMPGWEIDVRKEFILAVEEATGRWEAYMN